MTFRQRIRAFRRSRKGRLGLKIFAIAFAAQVLLGIVGFVAATRLYKAQGIHLAALDLARRAAFMILVVPIAIYLPIFILALLFYGLWRGGERRWRDEGSGSTEEDDCE